MRVSWLFSADGPQLQLPECLISFKEGFGAALKDAAVEKELVKLVN